MVILMERKFVTFLFIVIFFLSIGTVYAQEINNFGMSEEHFETCKRLGKQVMNISKTRPDSIEHKRAYKTWDETCGVNVMIDLAKKFKFTKIPASPKEWADMD
ncbi:MAG: hypothetical protein AB7S75_12740 [Desulfococcaceae bacterium]